MAVSELDPLFVKGLRLLHSKSKDSADQLKQLLDEAILQSKQMAHFKERTYSSVKLEGDGKLLLKKSREIPDVSNLTLKTSQDESRERKVEKRPFEKLKQESSDCSHESKIPKLESPQVFSYYPPSPDIPKLEQFVPRKDENSGSSDENADADDFAMGMGLACVLCKQIDVSQGNQLIECQECHNLYHQECHRPPATDYDVNDPRRVWYCAKCMKNMKKMATKTQKSSKSSLNTTSKEPTSQTRMTKPETTQSSLILPFKRSELKAPISQSNNQSSANKPIGLAGLAANLSGRTTTTASSTTLATSRSSTSKTASLKAFNTFSTSSKSSSLSGSSSKTTATSFPTASTSVPKATSSPTSASKTGLNLLSAAASSSRAQPSASNNGNSGHTKVASCSPLMNADKRVQNMKKRAAKMHEKRRLSTK